MGINPIYDKIWNNSPLNIITSAHAAVQMFFVISGFFVVMKTYMSTKEKAIFQQILHRILRLLEVVVPAIMLSYIILSCFVWKMLDRKTLYTVILILGFYCATVSVLGRGIYTPFKIFNYIHVESYRTIVRTFGVGVIVLLTLKSSVVQKIMDIRPLQFVGTYSAYIYGFHWTIILSIGCFMCMHMWNRVDFRIMMALISMVCVVITVAVSYIYVKTYKKIRKWINLRYRGEKAVDK